MNKEEIEQGMKCCNEFLCGECPYEKYDDKVSHQYIMRCIHMLMQDINKLYFGDGSNSWNNSFMWEMDEDMSDKEKIEKIYEFAKAQEDYFYKPIEDGKYELGSMANMQCMFSATAFQKVRYFIEDVMEENND